MRHALAEKVTQHNARFLVPVAVAPDRIEAARRRGDNVARVLCGRQQFAPGVVAVIRLSRERRRFHEHRNVPAELMLAAELFRRALRIAADDLAHGFIVSDSLTKRGVLITCFDKILITVLNLIIKNGSPSAPIFM